MRMGARSRRPADRATLAAAFAALAVLSTQASALTIQGHVRKGGEHAPVSGVSVQLHAVRGDQEEPGRSQTSDAAGAFHFDGLADDPAVDYYVAIEYQGAFYTEGPLPKGAGPSLVQDMIVYDVGRDIASVHVKNHHVVVERKQDGLHITEILVFENTGTTAYLGTGLNHAENAGMRVGLPASVKDFQPGMGGDAQTVHVQGRDLTGMRPIPPGVRPFSFTYRIPLSGRMDLSHRVYFPTLDFVVLVDDPKLKLESSSLQSEGTTEQGGRRFALYRGRDLRVGQEVEMRIQGAGFWSNPGIYPWLVAPFAIAAVLVYAARRGRAAKTGGATAVPVGTGATRSPAVAPGGAPSGAPTPRGRSNGDEELRQVYLYLIAALDQGALRGELPQEGSSLVRRNLKRRLGVVLGDPEAPGGGR